MAGYNLNPQPQAGSGAFGAVPGSLGLPQPYENLSGVVPNLGALNKTASGDILSNLQGTLSPATEHALQTASATFGTASGMPGSGLSYNSLYGNIAGASEGQQAQGLQQYNSFIPTASGTQTVPPGLQTQIAGTNASNAAAPDPSQSASYSEQLFNQYLNQLKGPGGGGDMFGSPAGGNDELTGFPNWGGFGQYEGSPYSVSSVGALPYQPDFAGSTDASAYAIGG